MMRMSEELQINEYNSDRDLIESVKQDRQPQVRIYRPKAPAVVLGRGSKPDIELDLNACILDDIQVYQRLGGGCAVVIDPGNVIISVVLPTSGITGNRKYFDKLSRWLIGKLDEIGYRGVYQDGISDLVVNNKKIGGSCIQRSKDHLYYSATLLVDPNIDMMERYLSIPPREPGYRQGRSHRDFVGTLNGTDVSNSTGKLLTDLKETITSKELSYLTRLNSVN